MEERLNRPLAILSTKLIVGLFVTIVGLLLTADNLDLFPGDRYLRYWPAILVVIGLLKLPEPGQRVLGTILTIAGVSLLALNAGWIRFSIFDLWPLLLIGIGASMVGRAVGVRVPEGAGHNIWAIFSTQKIRNTSAEFSGASIVAILGGCHLDLTEAEIAHPPAVIEALAFWGGIEITIPDRWEVIGEVVPFMGGFEIETSHAANPERRLIVRGAAVMGGIEIKRRTV